MNKVIGILIGVQFILTACTQLPSIDIATTASRNTLYGITNTYDIIVIAESTYADLCKQGRADKNCSSTIKKMQLADAKAITAIEDANSFINTYPTVDASNFLNAAQQAVSNFKQVVGDK